MALPQDSARMLIDIARTPWKWRLYSVVALALLACSGILLFMWLLSGDPRDPYTLFFGVLSSLGFAAGTFLLGMLYAAAVADYLLARIERTSHSLTPRGGNEGAADGP